jgi:hypothetical protein
MDGWTDRQTIKTERKTERQKVPCKTGRQTHRVGLHNIDEDSFFQTNLKMRLQLLTLMVIVAFAALASAKPQITISFGGREGGGFGGFRRGGFGGEGFRRGGFGGEGFRRGGFGGEGFRGGGFGGEGFRGGFGGEGFRGGGFGGEGFRGGFGREGR